MTREQYQQREWEYPLLKWRTMDIDGREFYFSNEPIKEQMMWVHRTAYDKSKPGKFVYGNVSIRFWAGSLQTYDQWLNLQNTNK
jgi:hypothetical protein